MAIIDKSLAPFTYTGSWDINEYSPGLFYARFLTSGTLTPKQDITVDAFLVGGGGAGGSPNTSGSGSLLDMCGGGGGGRTTNIYNYTISTPQSVNIGSSGQATKFGTHTASGGSVGRSYNRDSGPAGGAGGSGGGGASTSANGRPGNGGSNGSNGGKGGSSGATGGTGQGSSTRPFEGDVSPFAAMHFAGGGGGAWIINTNASGDSSYGGTGGGGVGCVINGYKGPEVTSYAGSGAANTGGGGGGGGAYQLFDANDNAILTKANAGSGGSGIVIIRGSLNLAPTDPDGITYGQPNAGKPLLLSSGGSTDPDGDSLSYVWEHRTDSGVYTQIGVTTEPQITATVPTSGTTYQARVKAVDAKGAESGYTTGPALTINYNNAPTISGTNEDKGALTAPPTYTYTVDDEDADQTLTVTESVVIGSNSIPLRTFEATRGTQYTADATAAWLRLPDDATHTLRIQVDDGAGGTAQRDITFTRTVERIAAARAVSTDAKVYKCLVSIYPDDRPADSTLHCEVSNNPFDPEPIWEDISNKLGRYVHVFDNQISEQLGFAVRFWIEPGAEDVTVSQMAVRIA